MRESGMNRPRNPSAFRPAVRPDIPLFMMPKSWAHPDLSDAAVAVLARNCAAGTTGGFDTTVEVRDELIAAGLIVDGYLVDPDALPVSETVEEPRRPRVDPRSVVYYLRRQDGAVKIGFTADLPARIERLTEVYGELVTLATEPGGKLLETQRHRQFDRWRLPRQRHLEGGSEWFARSVTLNRHLRSLEVTA